MLENTLMEDDGSDGINIDATETNACNGDIPLCN